MTYQIKALLDKETDVEVIITADVAITPNQASGILRLMYPNNRLIEELDIESP